ncbi:hypothetical protein G9A89_012014 [Geosiphon pyriformis]|nr:hypothetical protein G9A89_012014 [Geosiphon pyriformis]
MNSIDKDKIFSDSSSDSNIHLEDELTKPKLKRRVSKPPTPTRLLRSTASFSEAGDRDLEQKTPTRNSQSNSAQHSSLSPDGRALNSIATKRRGYIPLSKPPRKRSRSWCSNSPRTKTKEENEHTSPSGVEFTNTKFLSFEAVEVPVKRTSSGNRPEDSTILDTRYSTYGLTRIIRGHSETELGESDNRTAVWCCQFQPTAELSSRSKIVATCGGPSVCFIDCSLGKIITKYTHIEPNEELKTLAWSDLEAEGVEENSTRKYYIVATAGKLGIIKLIDYVQGQCYDYLIGHTDEVSQLKFSKQNKHWLFSASQDASIRMWHIGLPRSDNQASSKCLAIFQSPKYGFSSLCISNDSKSLFAGCCSGTMAKYNLKDISKSTSIESAPIQIEPIQHYKARRYVDWHWSYVDDMFYTQEGSIVSRGSLDGEIIVWYPESSGANEPDIKCLHEWPSAPPAQGMKFRVVDTEDELTLITGGENGRIYIYDLRRHSEVLDSTNDRGFILSKCLVSMVLDTLESDGGILCVDISDDLSTIVAVDNHNRIFVWER